MGFFDLDEKDLSDGKAVFNDGETADLVIGSVQKKDINNIPMVIIESIVVTGKNAGLKYPQFFRMNSDGGKKALGIFLTVFMTPAEAQAMQDPSALINKRYSAKFIERDGYVNMRGVQAVSDVPAEIAVAPAPIVAETAHPQPMTAQPVVVAQPVVAAPVVAPTPSAQPVVAQPQTVQAQQMQQAELSKSVF